MQRPKPVEVLRWIGVLPAAVLVDIAARYLGSLVARFAIAAWGAERESNLVFSIQLLAYAFAGSGFVLAAAFTAPRSRRFTAVVMAIAWTLLSLFTHVLTQSHPGPTNYWHLAAETAGAVVAIAYVWYVERKPGT